MNPFSIIALFLIIGLVVFIHEFGHFLLAKKNGVGVIEFSIGMGPRLLSTVREHDILLNGYLLAAPA